jgi:hypothetical protein
MTLFQYDTRLTAKRQEIITEEFDRTSTDPVA